MNFQFLNDSQVNGLVDARSIHVPTGIATKDQLMSGLAAGAEFPDYFGANWDALLDCLQDLSWVKERDVYLLHKDVPLKDTPMLCRVYLDVLKDAIQSWESTAAGEEEHRLIVVFPRQLEHQVLQLANSADTGS